MQRFDAQSDPLGTLRFELAEKVIAHEALGAAV